MTREDKRIEETNSAAEYFIAGPLCEEKLTEEQEDFVMYCFAEGAKWADNNPKSPWISVKDDLPCNHKELIIDKETLPVISISQEGIICLNKMQKVNGKWCWRGDEPTYWFPIPKSPK